LRAFLTRALALLVAAPAPQTAVDPKFEALAALVQDKMREFRIPGVALGVFDGGVTTLRAFGVTSVEDPLPVTEHTVFPIASISKTFTASAMMRLVEQGKVDLKAPVRRYLPDFRVQDENASRDVTIWNLLTHTPGWEGQVAPEERGTETLKTFVAGMGGLMQVAPPAAAWSYNNAGFSVAGRVIEVVTGKWINAAIREMVFQPLGLTHAGTSPSEFIANRFAVGHFNRGEAPTLQRPFAPSTSLTAGGVGLCITDLLAYARFHLGDGTGANGERVLSRQTLDLMKTPQLRKQAMDDDIGIAWQLRTVGPIRTAAHGGTLGGHILLLELVPERNFAVGILTNASNGWRLIQDVERSALKAYHDATFAKNQAIAHRGLVETLPTAEPLAVQPDPAQYVGRFERPMNTVTVRVANGERTDLTGGTRTVSLLVAQVIPNNGTPQAPMPLAFYGPDRAIVMDGPDKGQSVEFVRGADGKVAWIRVTGRVARRSCC
jgi:CubicO group peptidase (beta-lactamase class C family)